VETISPETAAIVAALGLAPHPEGGWYREIHRSPVMVATPRGPRAASTSIHFLLAPGDFSAWHRVASDEVWAWHAGDPVDLHVLDLSGHRVVRLGGDVGAGQAPIFVVPAGVWQAAAPVGPRHALCGCVVAPGFDFADFAMADRTALAADWPAAAAVVCRFTRA
jgi:hypothetical protein